MSDWQAWLTLSVVSVATVAVLVYLIRSYRLWVREWNAWADDLERRTGLKVDRKRRQR